ncbi:MAG: hypothetical protein ACI9C1_003095 [Candidatus Aldehydirespiratoraceae bacterium]
MSAAHGPLVGIGVADSAWGDEALIDDCIVCEGRIVSVGPSAASVRDAGLPVIVCLSSVAEVADHPIRLLFDAGFRVVFAPGSHGLRHELLLAAEHHGFTDVELAACMERAAGAAALGDDEREVLVAQVAEGWNARPARLVHLAEHEVWEPQRSSGSYLPREWARDGFIHLSSLHQLLTPANKFYRGRDDLVALVVDAHLLGAGVVWEAGTGTVERFPHLYSALTPDAVLAEIEIAPEPDGGFLLPPALMRAVRSPLGR